MKTLLVRNPTIVLLGKVLLPTWFLLVLAHYFSFRSVFGFSFFSLLDQSLSQATFSKFFENSGLFLRDIVCALLVAVTLWLWGRRIWNLLALRVVSPGVRFCLEMACGILLFNTLWLGLGLELLWRDRFVLGLAFFFCGSALWDLFRQRLISPVQFDAPKGLIGGALKVLVFLAIFFLFSQAVAPEVYFDALAYHLSTLQSWMFRHGIGDIPGNLYAHYPFGGELYFLNGFFFTGDGPAKLLNALAAVLTAILVGSWVREKGSLATAWGVGALVLLCPMVQTTVWAAQIDVLMGSFFLLYVYASVQMTLDKKGSAWPWAVGILGGGFFTLKYTAIVGLAAGALPLFLLRQDVFAFSRWKEWSKAKTLIWLLPMPWFLKNLVFAGNPVYPYLSQWFGGRTLPEANMNALLGDHLSPLHLGEGFLVWVGRVLHEGFDVTVGPVFFAFLPFLFLPAARRPVTRYLLAATGLYLLAGFAVSYQPRLLLPAFFLGFTAMGFVLEDLRSERWRNIWKAYVLVFGCLCLLIVTRLSVSYYHSGEMWLGAKDRMEYLATEPQTRSYDGLARAVNHFCRPMERVLIVGDARSLHYERDVRANSVFDEQVLANLAREEKDADGIYRRLRRMGIDDLAVCGEEGKRLSQGNAFYFRLTAEEWKRLDQFIQTRTDLLDAPGLYGLYRLRQEPVQRKAPIVNALELLRTQD